MPHEPLTGQASASGTTREQDIETARRFYAELLAFEKRMEAAGNQMRNRGRWLEAVRHLWEARESLQMFIGERMTADIRQERQREPQPPLLDDGESGNGEE